MGFTIDVSEGRQGKTRFFTGAMKWGDVGKQAVFPDQLAQEIDDGDDDDERMQRSLAKQRIPALVEYLIEAKDHFFSALTLIILPNDLDGAAVEGKKPGDEAADYWFDRGEDVGIGRQRRGTLHLSAAVRLFPADGQHRLKAAIEAMRKTKGLAMEEVPIVLVPYEGADQVRQLFADLNLNAKPVSRTVGLDFDTRTATVLLAKEVAKQVQLFDGRVNRISNSLSKTSTHTITMNGLVAGTRNLLFGLTGTNAEHEQDEYVEEMERKKEPVDRDIIEAWQAVIDPFVEAGYWDPVLAGVEHAAGMLREEYVFPHGLGWQALTLAAGQLRREFGDHWREAYDAAVLDIDWKRGKSWDGIAMSGDRVNNTGPGIRATANSVLEAARALAPKSSRRRKVAV